MLRLSIATLLIGSAAFAQQGRGGLNLGSSTETPVFRLWDGDAPGAQGKEDRDIPTITVYMPRSVAQPVTAIVVCPGGGYQNLASNHEGRQVASYLNSLGIAAVVLKYRLGPKYHHPVEIGDAQRAVRMLRAKAAEWRLAPDHIGIMGFSAGGHLAMSASTHFDAGKADAADPIDRLSSRPDFSILGYPVISLSEAWTHQGSRRNLLGDNPDPALVKSLSGENAVTPQTPPTFIFQTNADTTVPAENSIYYYLALRKAGVVSEMHVFQRGPHGVGLGMDDFALAQWPALLGNWLRVNGHLK
jgi:acetyl esterase/lipase